MVLGWRVSVKTRSHVLPRGFMERGDVSTSSGIGSHTIRLLHRPTENPVKPAMAPWTAFWASCIQYRESAAFAGTDRIVYDGSMYFTVATSPCLLKYSSTAFFMNSPILGRILFPLASVSEDSPSSSSPAAPRR